LLLNAREVVCVVVNHGFCWSLNPCRIIYTLEEKGEMIVAGTDFQEHPESQNFYHRRLNVDGSAARDCSDVIYSQAEFDCRWIGSGFQSEAGRFKFSREN